MKRKFKINIVSVIFVLFAIGLITFSKSNLIATKDGLKLWWSSVVPALLPFFIACELFSHTDIIDYLGRKLGKIMKPIFNVPGEGAFPFIMGIISGYPVGAKIVTSLRKNEILTKEESERLITFTNNSGPLFIIGTVGISLFANTTIGILLFITHLLSSLTVGIIFRFWKFKEKNTIYKIKSYHNDNKAVANFNNLGSIMQSSIMSSINTILMIGGFVVLFSVVISILNNSKVFNILEFIFSPLLNNLNLPLSFASSTFSGLIELTNGLSLVSAISFKKISVNIIISSFLLGFGGISILLQVLSITSTSDISIKPYIYGKLMQGFFAAFYTYILINSFPFFNFDI